MKLEHALIGLAGAYALAGVVAFGPASIEEDRMAAKKEADCIAVSPPEGRRACALWNYNEFRPILKSMAWPLWLSYRVARGEE
jgi:hypothetical protein